VRTLFPVLVALPLAVAATGVGAVLTVRSPHASVSSVAGRPTSLTPAAIGVDREDNRVSSQAASRSLLFMAQQVRLREAQARQREAHDRAVAAQARERAHLLAVRAQDAAHDRAAAQQQAARAAQVARSQQAAAQKASSQQAAAQQAASQQAAAAQPVTQPAPAPASSDSYSSSSAWAGSAHATRVRNCESGDNYQANTGNGYYGAYQFSEGTWQSVGGHGYPQQNSVQEQDYRAYLLWQRSGWSSWGCA